MTETRSPFYLTLLVQRFSSLSIHSQRLPLRSPELLCTASITSLFDTLVPTTLQPLAFLPEVISFEVPKMIVDSLDHLSIQQTCSNVSPASRFPSRGDFLRGAQNDR